MGKKRRIVLWLLMLLILSGLFFLKQGISLKHYANVDNGWNLILVNKNNYIPKNYEFELTELSNGEKVDSRISVLRDLEQKLQVEVGCKAALLQSGRDHLDGGMRVAERERRMGRVGDGSTGLGGFQDVRGGHASDIMAVDIH